MTDILELTIDQVQPDPDNVRYDATEDLDGLAASIKAQGLLQPLLVRPADDGEGYTIVSGHRRYHAMRKLRYREPFKAQLHATNGQSSAVAQITENLQREDLSFWEEARGFARLVEEYGMKQEQIAKMVGVDTSTVSKRLTIAKLPDAAEQLLSSEADGFETVLSIAKACRTVPSEVWATIGNRNQLNSLVAAQRAKAEHDKVRRAVNKAAKAAKNGRTIEIVSNLKDVDIPEKSGKVGVVEFEGHSTIRLDNLNELKLSRDTVAVVYQYGWVKPAKLTYRSEAEVAETEAERTREDKDRERKHRQVEKARDDWRDQIGAYVASLSRNDVVFIVTVGSILNPLTQWEIPRVVLKLAGLVGIDPIMVEHDPLVDDDGNEIEVEPELDVLATLHATMAHKNGLAAYATELLVEDSTDHRFPSGRRQYDLEYLVDNPGHPAHALLATGVIEVPSVRA